MSNDLIEMFGPVWPRKESDMSEQEPIARLWWSAGAITSHGFGYVPTTEQLDELRAAMDAVSEDTPSVISIQPWDSAPDLLEACKVAVADAGRAVNPSSRLQNYRAMQAAIAKAKPKGE